MTVELYWLVSYFIIAEVIFVTKITDIHFVNIRLFAEQETPQNIVHVSYPYHWNKMSLIHWLLVMNWYVW